MNIISTITEKLDAAQEAINEARALAQEATAGSAPSSASGVDSPEVREAAQRLATAIAKAQGHDLPLQMSDAPLGPVLELPEEFGKFGGVGIGVVVSPPTEAARQA